MIHVFDPWVIDSDGKQFICGELDVMKIKSKDNSVPDVEKEYIKNPMYHSTFSGSLQALHRRMQQNEIKGMNGNMEKAITVLQTLNQRFIDAINMIVESEAIQIPVQTLNQLENTLGKKQEGQMPVCETVKQPEDEKKNDDLQDQAPVSVPEKRKRGRPRKNPL